MTLRRVAERPAREIRVPSWWPTWLEPRDHMRAAETQLQHAATLLRDEDELEVAAIVANRAGLIRKDIEQDW